ncbi:hypothetical protein BZG36_01570 [Bifiguratus adelaidae]|uniref:START domain-containing protein n=1 Tax=Bifiguratus adelaidae TaxID=1938954 RepID=A0A261Y410_9FUNG|nr:hypothetical protein BZG36_01570 [Bifiguratus adelaidae]
MSPPRIVDNPHAEAAEKALSYLKELSASLDGWTFSSEYKGTSVYTRAVEGLAIPITRGDVVLRNGTEHKFTIEQVAAVCTSPGARTQWDDRFESAEQKEYYNHHEALFYSKLKGQWPVVYGRDIAGVFTREESPDCIYIAMCSVEDSRIPEDSSYVRANLYISGWKISTLKPEDDEEGQGGIRISYIVHVDVNGYLPSAFVSAVQLQTPLCAGRVCNYLIKNGFTPFIADTNAVPTLQEFDHEDKMSVFKLDASAAASKGEEGFVKIIASKQMYADGLFVKANGEGATVEESDGEHDDRIITIKGFKGVVTVSIIPEE